MKVIVPDYADKSDDELLDLALDVASLTPEARDALVPELKKRGLSSPDHLSRFADERKRAELEDQLGRLGLSWRGYGRKLYGKSNVEVFGTSEEYDATLFLVASYIPFIPTGTYRLSGEQGTKKFRALKRNKRLNWGQVVWIWTKTVALIIAIFFGFYELQALGIIKEVEGRVSHSSPVLGKWEQISSCAGGMTVERVDEQTLRD